MLFKTAVKFTTLKSQQFSWNVLLFNACSHSLSVTLRGEARSSKLGGTNDMRREGGWVKSAIEPRSLITTSLES